MDELIKVFKKEKTNAGIVECGTRNGGEKIFIPV